jgi:two-component system sensor histidine kinase SenX3
MYIVAAALLGTIALLATLQYRWLGRISDAERQRMTANLGAHSTGFAQEFDREITRAYVSFQLPAPAPGENLATRLSAHYERWIATARFPRLVKDVYLVSRESDALPVLQRFSPTTRFLEPSGWPESLASLREQASSAKAAAAPAAGTSFVIRSMPSSVIESAPALVIPMPVIFINDSRSPESSAHANFRVPPALSYVVLLLDRDYITSEMLPALMQQYFRASGSEADYQVAVVSVGDKSILYKSGDFAPDPAAKADASTDLFQVRVQDFGSLASEVRRFTTLFSARAPAPGESRGRSAGTHQAQTRQTMTIPAPGTMTTFSHKEGAPVSIVVQQELSGTMDRQMLERSAMAAGASAISARPPAGGAYWKLMVKHPSGSLEAAVNSARRRNLMVSSSVLALLGVSVGFLVLSTRRAQSLAQQQMEFVAAVSHELRTPLAVIRSAADNLADGVVYDDPQVRKYGDLVRGESRRLTEMVEQILELAGIHSGQRSFALRPVPLIPLLHDVVRCSSTLIEESRLDVQFELPDTLPPILGDEPALRRVFQNLVSNAIKYGASGGWIGVRAMVSGREVIVSVADKGIGIPAAEQQKIFEPFYRAPAVVAAQIHGAGLGLSLVHRIVEAHGGRIAVRSAEGSGSEFIVHLPAATEEPVRSAASARDAAASHS